MKKPTASLLAGLLSAVAPFACTGAFAADDGALRACRALGDAAARLACYDALPLPATAPVAQAAQPARAAAPVVATAAAAPAMPTPSSAGTAAAGSMFGLEAQRASQAQQVSSSIAGIFEGWQANTLFKLANGQVWQVVDGSSAAYYLKDPKVVVSRAALGSFRLEIEGARQAPRVRRVE